MNRERAKELLPIIQAFAEGKTIQFFSCAVSEWLSLCNDCSFFSDVEYRIKPEPRVFEVWRRISDGESMYDVEKFTPKLDPNGWERIKLQEIIE